MTKQKPQVCLGNSDAQSRPQPALPQVNIDRFSFRRHPLSFIQWFCNLNLGYKQLIALIVVEFASIVGLGIGARWIITSGLRTQLLNQAKSEVTVTESNINLKVNQTGLGFRGQADNAAIIKVASVYTNQTLPSALQEQVKQILQNEIKARNIQYATLVGKDFKTIVEAKANQQGKSFIPKNLVRDVFTTSKQIKANAIVNSAQLVKSVPSTDNQDVLVRYTLTPVYVPGTKKVIAALVSTDIVNGQLPIMAGILKDFGGGYSAIYSRKPTGEFALAVSLDQGKAANLEQAKRNVALSDISLLAAAAAAPNGQIVTGRMIVGTQTYTMTAKAIPNLIIQEASGPVPVFSGQPVTILVRGTPETTLNNLLQQSLWQERVVLLLALLVTATWASIFKRTITKPIEQLGRATQEFAEGDRSARAKIFSLDEVGQLAITFNRMADSIVTSEVALSKQARHQEAEAERTQLFTDITLRIRRSLNLKDILKTTVKEVRKVLKTNRVFIYRFQPDRSGVVVVESVDPPWPSILGTKTTDYHHFIETSYQQYKQGWIQTTEDIYTAGLSQNHIELLPQLQVKAKMVAPILQRENLWGLLVAEHCSEPRLWQQAELDLLKQLATQVAIAIQQSELYQQAQTELTERKQAEAELQTAKAAAEAANLAKSKFLTTMSHELRTPLNAVIGMTTLLLNTKLKPDQQGFVQTIRYSSNALLTLINDILDFSKIESGKLELEQQPFALQACVEASLSLVAALAAEKDLKLSYSFAPLTPNMLMGDAARLGQILANLLSNAVKFTEAGEVTVSVTAQELGAPFYEIQFAVKDTGIGIPSEQMGQLFKSFSQVNSSISRRYGGTGLGLAICKQLTEIMGGHIWAESQVGQGSTFYFTLVAQVSSLQLDIPHVESIPTIPRLALTLPLKILLAEDDRVNQQVALLLLDQLGYRADAVSNGVEVLKSLRRQSYDVVLMDIQMPEMDGLTATRQICQEWPLEQRPRIIGLTAYATQEYWERCLLVGMDDYISKPIQVTKLAQALSQCHPRIGECNDPVDRKTLQALRRMAGARATEVLVQIIDNYLEDTPQLLQAMRFAVTAGDAAALQQAAHKLRAASANLGAIALAQLCKAVEALGDAGITVGSLAHVSQVEAEYATVKAALQMELQRG